MGGLDRIFFENSDRLDPKSRSTTNWTKDFFRLQIFYKKNIANVCKQYFDAGESRYDVL